MRIEGELQSTACMFLAYCVNVSFTVCLIHWCDWVFERLWIKEMNADHGIVGKEVAGK